MYFNSATEAECKESADKLHEDDQRLCEKAWDDVTGKELDPNMVRRARQDEIGYFKKHTVYKRVPHSRCFQCAGKPPIRVRWVDINKGDDKHPNYRSRLVAMEIKLMKNPELLLLLPPWNPSGCYLV